MTGPSPDRGFRPGRVAAVVAAVVVVAVLVPGTAVAAGGRIHGGGVVVPFAFLGIDIPSISDILRSIANDLFKVLAGAFLPSWLRDAPASVLQWLIALPNPADPVQWPTMHRLEQDTTSVAVAFLPLTLVIAAARYTASGITGGAHHPAESLGRFVGASFGLVIFPWAFSNVVAAVNVTTAALLGYADIAQGLQRALALMFTGGLLFGVTGPLVALLVIGAILLAAGLFVMKVGILALFAILFVAGPLTLAGYPIPELHAAFRLWSGLLIAVAMVPIGWCVIFATAGAISADITHITTPAAIGTRIVGFFAGVLTFFIAFRWPFFLITMVRSRGLLSGDLGSAATRGATATGRTSVSARAQQGKLALLAAGGAAGATVSHLGRGVGMPRGGVAGVAGRAAVRLANSAAGTPTAIRTRAGMAVAWENLRDRAAGSRPGRSRVGQRAAAAGSVIRTAPAAVTAAVRAGRTQVEARAAAATVLAGAGAVGGRTNRAGRAGRATPPTSSARPAAAGAAENTRKTRSSTAASGTPPANGGRSSEAARASVDSTATAGAAAAAAAAHTAAAENTPRSRTTPSTPTPSRRTTSTTKPSTRKRPTATQPGQSGTSPGESRPRRKPGPGPKEGSR